MKKKHVWQDEFIQVQQYPEIRFPLLGARWGINEMYMRVLPSIKVDGPTTLGAENYAFTIPCHGHRVMVKWAFFPTSMRGLGHCSEERSALMAEKRLLVVYVQTTSHGMPVVNIVTPEQVPT